MSFGAIRMTPKSLIKQSLLSTSANTNKHNTTQPFLPAHDACDLGYCYTFFDLDTKNLQAFTMNCPLVPGPNGEKRIADGRCMPFTRAGELCDNDYMCGDKFQHTRVPVSQVGSIDAALASLFLLLP
jgi:hypothetical protein